ncbi:MAG: hypothetical protein ACKN9T_00980 [Candidatus Methylumidiphilus sp.]
MQTISQNTSTRLRRTVYALLTAACGLAAANAQGAVLYDGSLGTTPGQQGWTSVIFPFVVETPSASGVTLNTTFNDSLSSGYSQFLPAINSAASFSLSLTTQLLSESHSGNSNRAGFSVILLDNAHQGVELGFWTNSVWAQAVGFTRAEETAFNTTALTEYLLTFQGGNYTLSANNAQILTGPLRDYSAFGTPYNLNNFLFLGDDTSSAQASVKIAQVATVPLPPSWLLMLGPVLACAAKARKGKRQAGQSA